MIDYVTIIFSDVVDHLLFLKEQNSSLANVSIKGCGHPRFPYAWLYPCICDVFHSSKIAKSERNLRIFTFKKKRKKFSFCLRTAKICTSTKEQGNEVIVNCKKAAMIFHFFCCYLLLFSTAYFFISFLTSPSKSLKKVWAETKCCQIHSNCHKAKP